MATGADHAGAVAGNFEVENPLVILLGAVQLWLVNLRTPVWLGNCTFFHDVKYLVIF